MADDKPVHRRQFFRRGLGELLKPLAQALEPLEKLGKLADLQPARRDAPSAAPSDALSIAQPTPPTAAALWLRPPGALKEQAFKETCSRCAACVEVCPAQAIKLDRTGALGVGAPYIIAAETACVACDGLYCMPACPSGALVATPLTLIKMGTAVWREETCVRTRGEDCDKCVEVCPMGHAAIEAVGEEIIVKPLGCIGCGLCEQHCPTGPKSIIVIPKAAREI